MRLRGPAPRELRRTESKEGESPAITIPFLRVHGVLAPCISYSWCPLCLRGEYSFSSFDRRRPTNDERRPRINPRVRQLSSVYRLTSYVLRLTSNVFRLTFLPVLPVILPLVSWSLGGKSSRGECCFIGLGGVLHGFALVAIIAACRRRGCRGRTWRRQCQLLNQPPNSWDRRTLG
jgi:hypothetical protein